MADKEFKWSQDWYNVFKWPFHWAMVASLVLGIGLGVLFSIFYDSDSWENSWPEQIFAAFSTIFLSSLKCVVAPLVFCSVACSICRLFDSEDRNRTFKLIIVYVVDAFIACAFAWIISVLIRPGIVGGEAVLANVDLSDFDSEDFASETDSVGFAATVGSFVSTNIIADLADNNLLAIIVYSIFLGIFLARSPETVKVRVTSLFDIVVDFSSWVVNIVLKTTVITVTSLIAGSITTIITTLSSGSGSLSSFLAGVAMYYVNCLTVFFTLFIFLIAMVAVITRSNPLPFCKTVMAAPLTAFATASSSSALPISLECGEAAGVPATINQTVLSLGSVLHKTGSGAFFVCVITFAAQAFGVDLKLGDYIYVWILSAVGSIATPTIPYASLILIAGMLADLSTKFGVDLVSCMGFLLAIDRLLDMVRTAVNVFGDLAYASLFISKTAPVSDTPMKTVSNPMHRA